MPTRAMMAAAVLMGALAAPAGAQQHQHGQEAAGGMMESCPMMQTMHGQMMMGGMDGMDMQGMQGVQGQMMGPGMMGMMGAMHGGPDMILRSSQALALTPAQTEQLEALREQVRSEHQEHMQAAMAAHRKAAAALDGDEADLDAYTAALNDAADHMVVAHVAMARSTLDARGILTPEQRDKLGDVMGDMHDMDGMKGGKMRSGGGEAGHGGHH